MKTSGSPIWDAFLKTPVIITLRVFRSGVVHGGFERISHPVEREQQRESKNICTFLFLNQSTTCTRRYSRFYLSAALSSQTWFLIGARSSRMTGVLAILEGNPVFRGVCGMMKLCSVHEKI